MNGQAVASFLASKGKEAMQFEPLVALFALVFALVAAALPLQTWRARLIHAAYTGALVFVVAFVARALAERSLEDRFGGAGEVAAAVLERYDGAETSPGFATEALQALSRGGPRAASARRAVEAICRRTDCDAPSVSTAFAIRGALETVAIDARTAR